MGTSDVLICKSLPALRCQTLPEAARPQDFACDMIASGLPSASVKNANLRDEDGLHVPWSKLHISYPWLNTIRAN
jgi:hypothetical protein